MQKLLLILFFFLIILGVIWRLDNLGISKPSVGKIKVATSFYPLYFFTSQIGGNKIDTINITPTGVEPHDFEPTTRQIAEISQSRMLILNGGKLEGWGEKITDQLAGSGVLIINMANSLKDKQNDPHLWLDPVIAEEEAEIIASNLEKIDPQNSSLYKINSHKLEDQLRKLDEEYRQGLGRCQKREFITSHAAFGYLAARYGINQVSISGLSPDEEPSSQKLAEITDLVKKENIKVIFFESLVSPKLSQILARETGTVTMVLDPIEGIKNGDYFSAMYNNLYNLQDSLQCKR